MDKERLKYLLNLPFAELSKDKDLKKELVEFYKFIYGVKGCSSCKDKFPTYYQKLSTDGVDKLTMKTSGQFKLRTNIGVLQINFGDGKFISPQNCADEICIEFLRANPNRISLFSDYPANWKELIK